MNRNHLATLFVNEIAPGKCDMFVIATKHNYGYVAKQNNQSVLSGVIVVGRVS